MIMSEELYNELLKAYSKEVLASMIKADIRKDSPTYGKHVAVELTVNHQYSVRWVE